MAAYHFSAKAICRSKGQSAVHTAAYNARDQLYDEREGRWTRNYANKGEVLFSGIFAPKDAPDWARDREQLWNRAEAADTRINSQPARNIDFAVPHELTQEQQENLIKDFARETFARRGMVADISMHAPDKEGDERNVHVHCLLTMRKIEGEEFAPTKCRDWNSKAELGDWREKWAHMGARALARAGHEVEAARFEHGHEPLAQQRAAALARGDMDFASGLDRSPTQHKGVAATSMERRGVMPDRVTADREILKAEREIEGIMAELGAARAEQQPQARAEGIAPPTEPRGAAPTFDTSEPAKAALHVVDAVTGVAEKLADFVLSFLGGGGETKAPPVSPDQAEQRKANRKAIAALEAIRESIERGEGLKPEDVGNLLPTHLDNIKARGDDALRQLIERMEYDRQREQEYGRARER